MRKTLLFISIIATLLVACSSETPIVADDGNTIAAIKIIKDGAVSSARPNMADICKGFLLSKRQVQTFFTHATYVDKQNFDKSYNILPCYASGTAIVNNEKFNWTIRSGGIGEFTGQHHRFLKICGKGCCDKIPGMC